MKMYLKRFVKKHGRAVKKYKRIGKPMQFALFLAYIYHIDATEKLYSGARILHAHPNRGGRTASDRQLAGKNQFPGDRSCRQLPHGTQARQKR